jgi:hypothetical protein
MLLIDYKVIVFYGSVEIYDKVMFGVHAPDALKMLGAEAMHGELRILGYFTTWVKLHGQWGPRLDMSVHRAWIRMPGYRLGSRTSMWLVTGMILGAASTSLCFTWLLTITTWGLMWTG